MTEKMTNEELAKRLEIMNPLDMDDALIDEACRRLRAMSWRPIEEVKPPDEPHFRAVAVYLCSGSFGYWDISHGYVNEEFGQWETVSGDDCGCNLDDFTLWLPDTFLPQPPEPTHDRHDE